MTRYLSYLNAAVIFLAAVLFLSCSKKDESDMVRIDGSVIFFLTGRMFFKKDIIYLPLNHKRIFVAYDIK